MFSRALAEGLAQTGENAEAIATIDAALARAEQTGGAYDVPDLLRVKGQILLSSSNGSTEAVEQMLLQSLTVARKQSALSSELRSAIAVARLWARYGLPRWQPRINFDAIRGGAGNPRFGG
jgi:predicted ATPase